MYDLFSLNLGNAWTCRSAVPEDHWGLGGKKKQVCPHVWAGIKSLKREDSLLIVGQVIKHHDNYLLIRDAVLVDYLIGMAGISLKTGGKKAPD